MMLFVLLPVLCSPLSGQSVFPYCQGNLYGLVSTDGTIILPPTYDLIQLAEQPANAEVFVVYHQRLYGLIDKLGKEIFPPTLNGIQYRGTGFAWYYEDDRRARGLHVYSTRHKKEVYYSDSLRLIETVGSRMFFAEIYNAATGHTVLINESGKIVIAKVDGEVSIEFPERDCPLIVLGPRNRQSYFDCKGNPAAFEAYYGGREYHGTDEELQELGGENQVIVRSTPVFPPDIKIKEEILKDGMVVSRIAVRNGKFGLLSPSGEEIIPFEYSVLERTYDYIESRIDASHGLFTITGKMILPTKFRAIDYLPHQFKGYFPVHTHTNYCGFADKNGNVFLPAHAMPK